MSTKAKKLWPEGIWRRMRYFLIGITGFIYSKPALIAFLMATFSGIFLASGLSLILQAIGVDAQRLGMPQIVGLLLLIAAIMHSWTAWSAQQFWDYLRDTKDHHGRPRDQLIRDYKREEFRVWPHNCMATWALFLSLIFLVAAIAMILALATRGNTNTIPQSIGCLIL